MNDLIEALTIFKKYLVKDSYSYEFPTQCKHDVLIVNGIAREDVSVEDIERLKKLSFTWDQTYMAFSSYKFGYC